MNSRASLAHYIPVSTVDYVLEVLKRYPVVFKVVKPRKTKLGDFRALNKTGRCQITINNNLEPLNFLITTIHEIAHLYNWMQYKGKIDPHGKEWKRQYVELFLPLLTTEYLSLEEVKLLKEHLSNPKASSCSDINLINYFRKEGVKRVEEISLGKSFILNGRTFTIEKKLRKRYLCLEEKSQRKYYVNGMAEVEEIELP